MIGVAPLALASRAYLRMYQPKVWTVSLPPGTAGLSTSTVSSPPPRSEPRCFESFFGFVPSLWPN
jgi:hypothetical protein